MQPYMRNHPTPKMPVKETMALIRELAEIRDTATMETAQLFGFDPDRQAKNAELRERTRIWRQTWLIRPLNEMIKRYEAALGQQTNDDAREE